MEHGETTMRWKRSRWVPGRSGDDGLDHVGVRDGDDGLARMRARRGRGRHRQLGSASPRTTRRPGSGIRSGSAARSAIRGASAASPASGPSSRRSRIRSAPSPGGPGACGRERSGPPFRGCVPSATRRRRQPIRGRRSAPRRPRPGRFPCRRGGDRERGPAGKRRSSASGRGGPGGRGSVSADRFVGPSSRQRTLHAVGNPDQPRRLLARLEKDVVSCRACPRLVDWREEIGREKRAAYRDEDYWAKAVPGFGDPGGAPARRRPRPGRARCQPHRADVHRRPVRRLALPGAVPGRLRVTAGVDRRRRRPRARRRLDHVAGQVRATGQQADHRGARRLPPVLRPGARGARRP